MKPTSRIALILAGSLVPAVAPAQIPEVQTGLRLRVDARPVMRHTIMGTLMSRSGDTLVIASNAAIWHRVSKESIRRIDVSSGQSRIGGALKGITMFGIVPSLLTLAVVAPKGREPENIAFSVAIVGSVLGGFVGLVLGTEAWDRIYPARDRQPPRRDPYWTG